MVSRIHFYCPGCGAEEVPVLIQTPYYNCENCQTITPRDKLDRKRRNNYLLAGALPPWTVTPAGVFANLTTGPSTATTPAFNVPPGAMVVAIIADAGDPGLPAGPDSVKLNNTDSMTQAIATNGTDMPFMGIYYYNSALTTSGKQAIVVDYTTAQPQDIVISFMIVQGQIAGNPVDKTKVNTGQSFVGATALWSTGATTTQTTAGNLAIGAVCGDSFTTGILNLTPSPAWTRGQYVNDDNIGAGDGVVYLIDATQIIPGKAAVTFNGTGSSGMEGGADIYSAVLATFKHA